ncbi:MAG TPA: sensor histidine kinase [Actinomycetospora sp.]|nr:sensor histidine kinase [Actinomycetospora sp.]
MPIARPTRVDALLAVAVAALVAVAVLTDPGPAGRVGIAAAFAVVLAGSLLLARQWPLPVLLATSVTLALYYALDLPAMGLAAPVAPALYLAADRGRALAAAAIGAVLLAVSVTVRLVEGDDLAVVLGAGLGSEAALMAAAVALGDAVRSRRSLRAEYARRAAAADEERRREAATQIEAERVRIARELHDTLGHAMSVVALQSAAAQEALDDGDGPTARTALAAIRSAGTGAMTELRATVGTLRRQAERGPAPGLDALPDLADRVTAGGLPVDLHVEGEVDGLPVVTGATAYRIVQEALTNTLRHAHAGRVTVTVCADAAGLTLEIVDDGRGPAPASEPAGDRHGLRGMTERVELLGGALDAGAAPDGGYRVHAHLPVRRSRP